MTEIFAHRGSPSPPAVRENTIAAFIAAARLGADGVELDVWQTAGGELAVHHDRHVPGVGDMTAVSIGDLPPYVPTLAEALDASASHGLAVNIEIKCNGACDRVADAVAGAIENGPARLLVSSFHTGCLTELHRVGCSVPLGLLVEPTDDPAAAAALAVDLGCATLHPFVAQVDADLVDLVHSLGIGLHVWTVNADAELEAMAQLGVAAVITDSVPSARAVLERVAGERHGGESGERAKRSP